MNERDVEMLRHIEAEDVTFHQVYKRGSLYRLWSSEMEYEPVTRQVRPLVEAGLARESHGWQHGRGAVEITTEGRAALSLRAKESA